MRVDRHFALPGESAQSAEQAAVRSTFARTPDVALTTMLLLQCAMLFIAAPFVALGYTVPRYSIDLLVLALCCW